MADTDDTLRILPFPEKRQRMTWREMGMWFLRLGTMLIKNQMRWQPEGVLVVLINEDKLRVLHAGFRSWELYDEAAQAAVQQFQYEHAKSQGRTWERTPQEARRQRRKYVRDRQRQQMAYETEYAYICQYAHYHRFRTERGKMQHERTCHERDTPHYPSPSPVEDPCFRPYLLDEVHE